MDLSEVPDLDDSLFQKEEERQVQATPDAEEDVLQLPLPETVAEDPLEEADDITLLMEQQKMDESLDMVTRMANRNESGYKYEEGLVVHIEVDELGTAWMRVVMPKCRCQSILALAHSNPIGGHFGVKSTTARVRKHFTWPGFSVDIKSLCTSCPQCQKAAWNDHIRAPLEPLPIITVPFSRLAFDVVGPRTRSGFKYVLTYMCNASKYPEAIPLKRVDAQSVAEGMVEVYSRTGLPTEILTDQGTVFMSALHKQLCDILEIKHIITSPYHPESDGMLERWHASMKSMIKKTELDHRDWDKCLKYLLFAYRSTPHSVTGLSPFELIYGRDVRGPLELLKDGWMIGKLPERGLHDWVEQLKEIMEAMAQLASTREKAGKVRMKQSYDKKAKSRSFEMGSMVLMRVPGLTVKLEDSW